MRYFIHTYGARHQEKLKWIGLNDQLQKTVNRKYAHTFPRSLTANGPEGVANKYGYPANGDGAINGASPL